MKYLLGQYLSWPEKIIDRMSGKSVQPNTDLVFFRKESHALKIYNGCKTDYEFLGYSHKNENNSHTSLEGLPVYQLSDRPCRKSKIFLPSVRQWHTTKAIRVLARQSLRQKNKTNPSTSTIEGVSFEDPKIRNLGEISIRWFAKTMKESSYDYSVFSRTFLGMARSGDLIPWNKDVDIAVHSKGVINICHFLESKLSKLNALTSSTTKLRWTFYRHSDGPWQKEDVTRFSISSQTKKCKLKVSKMPFYYSDGKTKYKSIGRFSSQSDALFRIKNLARFQGIKVCAPHNFQSLLTKQRGDRKNENKQFSYLEYANAENFNSSGLYVAPAAWKS